MDLTKAPITTAKRRGSSFPMWQLQTAVGSCSSYPKASLVYGYMSSWRNNHNSHRWSLHMVMKCCGLRFSMYAEDLREKNQLCKSSDPTRSLWGSGWAFCCFLHEHFWAHGRGLRGRNVNRVLAWLDHIWFSSYSAHLNNSTAEQHNFWARLEQALCFIAKHLEPRNPCS